MTRRPTKRGVSLLATFALLGLLATPVSVSAATPILTDTWTVIPTQVQDDDYVAFRGSIRNDDTSTVSQLYLVERVRDPNLTLVSVTSSQGSCNSSGATFICTLGQLKPNRTASVTAIFRTALVPAGDLDGMYAATESWAFNTTGLGSGGGDNSHGDDWPSDAALTVSVTNSGDFGGRYVLNSGLTIVENSQALSNANPHSTRAYAPASGIGVTVEDIDCTIVDPDPACSGFHAGGFGEISAVNVNNGVDVSGTQGTTLLHFYIQLDSSEVPNGANANNVFFTHTYPGGSETIDTDCTYPRKGTIPTNDSCLTVKSLPGGDLGVDLWTRHNGTFRPGF